MHPLLDDDSRQVIPRWRPSRLTMRLGELASSSQFDRSLLQAELIAEKLEEWKRERSLSFATDVLASAIIAGEVPDACEAAEFVLSSEAHASEAAKAVARRVISPQVFDDFLPPGGEANQDYHRAAVRAARARTRADARNALAWVDMSLAYASLGFPKQAADSMEIALVLAPINRFVLRSAARLFVHLHQFDKAHQILRSAPGMKSDPWLIAAEIAVSELNHAHSRLIKIGSRLIERHDIPPLHVSEVASAVATIELESGNSRAARKLFKTSLTAPTDNSLAQASWVSRTSRIISVNPSLLDTPRSFEARTREHLQKGEWDGAFAASLQWIDDEPFATGPVMLACHIATAILDKFAEGLQLLRRGRLSNPSNWILINNVAFCLATLGQVEEAAEELSALSPHDDPGDVQKPGTLLATRGLIEFRRGNITTGRSFYLSAIEHFATIGSRTSRAIAALYLAREEVLGHTSEVETALKRARDFTEKAELPHLFVLLERIEKLAGIPNVALITSASGR
jgi:tetratricopeptide (TPR) repeat protein